VIVVGRISQERSPRPDPPGLQRFRVRNRITPLPPDEEAAHPILGVRRFGMSLGCGFSLSGLRYSLRKTWEAQYPETVCFSRRSADFCLILHCQYLHLWLALASRGG
jgi:hypothetical protein